MPIIPVKKYDVTQKICDYKPKILEFSGSFENMDKLSGYLDQSTNSFIFDNFILEGKTEENTFTLIEFENEKFTQLTCNKEIIKFLKEPKFKQPKNK